MIDMMEYKGYLGSVHYSDDDQCFYGKIEHIRDLISYEGRDVASIRKSFEDSVNDYLKTCKAKHKVPDKPFKGSFNVRISKELHKNTALLASKKGLNLNDVVKVALSYIVKHEEVLNNENLSFQE